MCDCRLYDASHVDWLLFYWLQNDDGVINAIYEYQVISFFIYFVSHLSIYSLMMEMANFKGSKFYFVNGHFFYWTFFLSRPLLIVPYWSYVNRHLQNMDTLLDTIGTGHLLMNLVMSVALDALNCYWTVFLSKG